MASIYGAYRRLSLALNPPEPTPTSNPLKCGILGAANIAPIAFVKPVKNHPDTVLWAVAARNQGKADEFAKKWGIKKAYGGQGAYQKLLDDPEIEVVYNPLPNGLHYEWTMKALAAGKHVLLEKPSSNTAEETRKMFEFADKKGLVLLEAFHYRFHPASQRLRQILIDNKDILGPLKHVHTTLAVASFFVPLTDIRYDYSLGGGSMMDMGCYTLSMARYLTNENPTHITSASASTNSKAFPNDPDRVKVDSGVNVDLAFPGNVKASLTTDFKARGFGPWMFGKGPFEWGLNASARVECERGEVLLWNFPGPWVWHYIQVVEKDERGGVKRKWTEKAYGNELDKSKEGWTTYRYQLEAFVDKIRGREPQHWFHAQESIDNMVWIEKVYEELGLGSRPKCTVEVPGA